MYFSNQGTGEFPTLKGPQQKVHVPPVTLPSKNKPSKSKKEEVCKHTTPPSPTHTHTHHRWVPAESTCTSSDTTQQEQTIQVQKGGGQCLNILLCDYVLCIKGKVGFYKLQQRTMPLLYPEVRQDNAQLRDWRIVSLSL